MISFQCHNHNQPISFYCQDHTCTQRSLCVQCEHEHDKILIQTLIEGDHIKELLKIFSTFKSVIIDNLNKMELELNNNLLTRQPVQSQTLEKFEQYLSDLTNEQQTLKTKIQNRLVAIINAIKSPDYDQASSMHFDVKRREQHSKSFISQAQQQQEYIKKQRQSRIFKLSPNPLSRMEETQQLLFQANRKEERVVVQRLKEQCTQDWPWKMTSSTIFCCIFVAKFDMKLLGFLQPCLYKSSTNNYQKKSAVITVGIYNKKNLTKQPILLEKFTLRHSKMNIVNDCYELMFSKPVQLKELNEYSLAIWPSRVLFCHYFSIAAQVNDYIAFQTQDFNDNPKIKRSEDFPQVISTYRAGLVPYLIVDPRQ